MAVLQVVGTRPGLQKGAAGSLPAGVGAPTGIVPPVRSRDGSLDRLRPLPTFAETEQTRTRRDRLIQEIERESYGRRQSLGWVPIRRRRDWIPVLDWIRSFKLWRIQQLVLRIAARRRALLLVGRVEAEYPRSGAGAPVGSRGPSAPRISLSRRGRSGLSAHWLPGSATSITTIDIFSLSSNDKLSCSLFSSSWGLWGRAPLGGIGTPLLPNQRTR